VLIKGLKYDDYVTNIIYKYIHININLARTTQRTDSDSITKVNIKVHHLRLFREISDVYCKSYKKHHNTP
jgi:hypothetical protein